MRQASAINLIKVFDQTRTHDYVVMKSLPNGVPEPGSDIDILCADKSELGKVLLRNCRALIGEGYTLRLRDLPEADQAHLDILRGEKIALRLDLHEGLGAYQRVPIKETFAQRVLDRRRWEEVACPAGQLSLAVPDEADNLVLRYLEYHEWFDARPDKVKHADHIAATFADDPESAKVFYSRLMQATSQRPNLPTMRHTDLNLKRQVVWLYWSVRDKLAWRLASARNIAVMALTQPGVFASKLVARLRPGSLRPRNLQHKA